VIRTNLAVTTALIAVATLFGSPAGACISCSYTPEVVNTPAPGAKAPKAKKVAKPQRTSPPAKKQIAKKPPTTEPAETAKAEDATKDVASKDAGSKDVATGTEAASAEVDTAANPSSSGTSALARRGAVEPTPEAAVGCKKFSATLGATVTVPCD
jgi:hypothetical protein